MKKTIVLTMLIVLALVLAGCDDKSSITPEQMKAIAASLESVSGQIDTYQLKVNALAGAVEGVPFVDADKLAAIKAGIPKINEEIDRVQPQLSQIAQAIQQQQLSGDGTQDWIALLQAGNAASAGFNPYAVPIGAGLVLLNVVFGVLLKKKSAEAATERGKYKAHEQGVERTMKEVSASDKPEVKAVEAQLYNNIGEARMRNGV